MIQEAKYWINTLGLKPHPEGGYYKEFYRADEEISMQALPQRYQGNRSFCTSIYYLLQGNDYSAFHRLKSNELWHYYAGQGGLIIYTLEKNREFKANKLGIHPDKGEYPTVIIRKGQWFAAELSDKNNFSLVGCTTAPGFEFDDFDLGDTDILKQQFPRARDLIDRLSKI